jgi:hypothetical protein
LWPILVRDFAAIYHVDLEDRWKHVSFRWFRVRVNGILSDPKSLTYQFLHVDEPAIPQDDDDYDEMG